MDTPYKEIDYKDMSIKIYVDYDAESPREWDNIGTIYSRHRDYNPDKHRLDELWEQFYWWENNENKELEDYLNKFYYWLPIGCYEHGGITVWAGNPRNDWDSGTFGVIAVRKEDARKEFPKQTKTKTLKYLEGEIKDLDMWYTNEVYGFVAEDEEGEHIDSCWGFFGDSSMDEMIAQAKSAIDDELERRAKEEREAFISALSRHLARRKEQIKSHAPLYARTAFAFEY